MRQGLRHEDQAAQERVDAVDMVAMMTRVITLRFMGKGDNEYA